MRKQPIKPLERALASLKGDEEIICTERCWLAICDRVERLRTDGRIPALRSRCREGVVMIRRIS